MKLFMVRKRSYLCGTLFRWHAKYRIWFFLVRLNHCALCLQQVVQHLHDTLEPTSYRIVAISEVKVGELRKFQVSANQDTASTFSSAAVEGSAEELQSDFPFTFSEFSGVRFRDEAIGMPDGGQLYQAVAIRSVKTAIATSCVVVCGGDLNVRIFAF